jgi:hypothetical protein
LPAPAPPRSQLLEAERRYATLKQHASEAEAAWEEMVGQAEADLEAQAERDGARLAQMSADMGEVGWWVAQKRGRGGYCGVQLGGGRAWR